MVCPACCDFLVLGTDFVHLFFREVMIRDHSCPCSASQLLAPLFFPLPSRRMFVECSRLLLRRSQHCSLLSMDQESPCALRAHPRTVSSINLASSCLFLTQNKKNNIPCFCHTPWSPVVRIEMEQKSLLFLHSGACLFENGDGKMIRFRHTKLLAQNTGPSPSPASTVVFRLFLLIHGVFGFFWDDFYCFSSQKTSNNFCESD